MAAKIPFNITSRKRKIDNLDLDSNTSIFTLKEQGKFCFREMSFLSDKTTEIGLPSELSLFTVPPDQVAVEKIYFAEYRAQCQHMTRKRPR